MESTALRIGGDEFLVLAGRDPNDPDSSANHFADRVEAAIRAGDAAAHDLEVRTSIGCAWADFANDPQSLAIQLDHLVDCADLAQVKAKTEGGARVCHYSGDQSVHARRRVSIHRRVGHGWQRDEMSLV